MFVFFPACLIAFVRVTVQLRLDDGPFAFVWVTVRLRFGDSSPSYG